MCPGVLVSGRGPLEARLEGLNDARRPGRPCGPYLTNPSGSGEVVMALDPGPGPVPLSPAGSRPSWRRRARGRTGCPPANCLPGLPDLLVDLTDHQREPVLVGMLAAVLFGRLGRNQYAPSAGGLIVIAAHPERQTQI